MKNRPIKRICPTEIWQVLCNNFNRIVSIGFIKRTNGEYRRIVCRFQKQSRKIELRNRQLNLFLVTDLQCQDENRIRTVSIEGIQVITAKGIIYKVNLQRRSGFPPSRE